MKANISAPDNELFQMSVVQSFEICFELSWKVLKDFLAQNGINVYLPRDVIKTAFVNEVIKNGQVWIDMMNARNATSQEYNSDKINQIINSENQIITYAGELDELPTPYMFDVTDYKRLSHQGMKDCIDRDGIVFYQRD